MGSSSLNKPHFHFVCTNYGSNKDGIGHYTLKIVNELKKHNFLNVSVYSSTTHNLSPLKLFLSLRMSIALLKLKRALKYCSTRSYIVLEYPFVEYNPLFILILLIIKSKKKSKTKIIISLHEYSRTKIFRKLFINLIIPISDIVLFTKDEDVEPFKKNKIIFNKRIIPANIQPLNRKLLKPMESINIAFFGIINFETKEIKNMILGWELYLKKSFKNRISFYFISSTSNAEIRENNYLNYCCGLKDDQVSNLLHKVQFVILPLKPRISVNNGSLAVSCIHECIPVGMFDCEYFDKNFGLNMENYSVEEFVNVYKLINGIDFSTIERKSELAYEYGKLRSITNAVKSYAKLIEL